MFHYYGCPLFIIIPPVTDINVMLKRIEYVKGVSSKNT